MSSIVLSTKGRLAVGSRPPACETSDSSKALIGLQNGASKAQLGPLLNGLVSYGYWLPVRK